MFTRTQTPNATTIFLEWPNPKKKIYYINKNIHREYIKLVWIVSKQTCWFRVYFNIGPDYPGHEGDSKIAWFFNNDYIKQEGLPYIIFYDKGKNCYKGSIMLMAVGGSTGYCTFHLLEY